MIDPLEDPIGRAKEIMEEMITAKKQGFAPLDAQNKRDDAILLLLYAIACKIGK